MVIGTPIRYEVRIDGRVYPSETAAAKATGMSRRQVAKIREAQSVQEPKRAPVAGKGWGW